MYLYTAGADTGQPVRPCYAGGADVLNNSWGYNEENYWSSDIADALSEAMTEGRNGLGCVVVFAVGNFGFVMFPVTVPGVIAVGGMDHNCNKYTGSADDPRIDLVAPTRQGSGSGGIVTMDRMGDLGYSNNSDPEPDYTFDFGGTSAAAPQVSGIAALMLAVNPDLTNTDVVNILKGTAIDLRVDSHWDGVGLVNVYDALRIAELKPYFNTNMVTISWSNYSLEDSEVPRTFINMPDPYADGMYFSDVWKYEIDVPTSAFDVPSGWLLGYGPDDITGYSEANPNDCEPYLDIDINGANTHLTTFYYYLVYNSIGQAVLDWIPQTLPLQPLIHCNGALGDVNTDGIIDVFDIVLTIQYINGERVQSVRGMGG
ncbi:MAG: S8 family serine peptidase [Fidelibacterota bacterium]